MSYAIEISGMSVYYGQTPAVRDINLNVKQGEYLGIIGPNGGGKSTLLKAILGLVPVSAGTVSVFGCKPGKSGVPIGYIPQHSSVDRQFPITVLEVVLTGRIKKGISPFFRFSTEDRDAAQELLGRVGIQSLRDRQISELSGGELQKTLIARALAVSPRLLLLDEPTASVDAASREQIYELLADLNRDMTIILVTHDLLAISSKVHRLACLNGKLVYHREPELTEDVVGSLYGCPVDLIAHGVPHRVLKEHEEEKQC